MMLLPLLLQILFLALVTSDGRYLVILGERRRFTMFGNTYGGDGITNFALPNLSGVKAITDASGTALHWIIVVNGIWPQ